MREIKFRARDKKDGKWYYFTLQELVNGATQTSEFCDIDLVDWSQYTGLKDKSGKEIYEGYIVSGIFRKGVIGLNDITLGKVMFYSPSFYICPPSENKFIMPFNDNVLVDKDTNYKIIGNIYENPELLK